MSTPTRTFLPQQHGLAARMGRWSATHWKTATFGWLAFVVVAFALGGMVGTTNVDQNAPGPGESGRMQKVLDAGFKQPAGENVLVQSRSARVGDPAFTAAIRDVTGRVSKLAAVQNVRRGAVSKAGTPRSSCSTSAGTAARPPTRSSRSSRASPPRNGLTPASRSASSVSRAPRRKSRRRTGTTSARPGCSRCRSRS